jgi:D-tyrosyl-tRNA(Tyr) deacylase
MAALQLSRGFLEFETLYLHFAELLRTRLPSVECGVFGADMKVDIAADGPVTIVMDSTVLRKGRAK